MSPRIFMDLVEALMQKGYSYDDAGPLASSLMSDPSSIVDIPDFVGPPRSDDLSMQAEGGRVGLQNGGPPFTNFPITTPETPTAGIGFLRPDLQKTYEEALARIEQTYPTDSAQTIARPGPQAEALQSIFGPTLAQFLGRPISPTGGTNVFGQPFGSFLPQQQAQNRLQQLQIEQALGQAGLGRAQFDPRTGGLTGVTGTGTGVAGFQPFLDQATTTADRASQEAIAGQDAGLQQLQNAERCCKTCLKKTTSPSGSSSFVRSNC